MPFALFRLHLFACILALFGASDYLQGQSIKISVYDSVQQIESRIRQAGNDIVVVNFWATWCIPCVQELPTIERLHEQYAGQNVQVILVSLDFRNKLESKLIPFLKSNPLRSEIILFASQDGNDWIPRINEAWDGAIPATFVFKEGQRGFKLGQFSDFAEIDNMVRQLLPTLPTPAAKSGAQGSGK
jgi:thiol-disulfide isomerase/thioredoxin